MAAVGLVDPAKVRTPMLTAARARSVQPLPRPPLRPSHRASRSGSRAFCACVMIRARRTQRTPRRCDCQLACPGSFIRGPLRHLQSCICRAAGPYVQRPYSPHAMCNRTDRSDVPRSVDADRRRERARRRLVSAAAVRGATTSLRYQALLQRRRCMVSCDCEPAQRRHDSGCPRGWVGDGGLTWAGARRTRAWSRSARAARRVPVDPASAARDRRDRRRPARGRRAAGGCGDAA